MPLTIRKLLKYRGVDPTAPPPILASVGEAYPLVELLVVVPLDVPLVYIVMVEPLRTMATWFHEFSVNPCAIEAVTLPEFKYKL